MSFFDVDKIAKDAADRIVERVVKNLTAVVDEYKEDFQGVSGDLTGQVDEAKDAILDGFDQIIAQLTTMTILLYVILAIVIFNVIWGFFVFFYNWWYKNNETERKTVQFKTPVTEEEKRYVDVSGD